MRKPLAAACLLGLTALAIPILAVPSTAAEPTIETIVSANPDNWPPNVQNGKVESMVQVGNRIIATGTFTSVVDKNGTAYTRKNVFAFNATTGAVDTTFVPEITGKEVTEVVDAGDGTVFIGGKFSAVNGVKSSKVARIDAASGAVITTFKAKAINGAVNDMQLVNNKLYIGGIFTSINGTPRTLLAALNPTTGADTGTVNLTFAGLWNGGKLAVKKFDISDDGNTLVAIGNFRTVDGQSRPQIMMADLSGPNATLASWWTSRYSARCANAFDTYMRDVDIDPTGTYFVVGATGAYSGGVGSGTLCDAVSRWELTPTTTSSQDPSWVDYSGGDTFTQVKATGAAIYVGGHFRWLNNPYSSDSRGVGAVVRTGLAALDPRNGLPFTWNPTRNRGVGVWEFMTTNAGLWMGHDTAVTAKEKRGRLAFFPTAGGTALPAENVGSLPGDVYLLGNNNAVTERDFTGSAVTGTQAVGNGGQTWSSARGAVMIDGTLYTGWSNGTLRSRTFDGTTFGAATTVNLNGLTQFANEIPNITGMFYDKASGRLYYTMSGQSQLYYRYFEPESQIVGSVRFTALGNGNGISWSDTTGLMLAGGNLYVASASTGNLAKVGWSNGTLSGTATAVSGPSVDGNDWRGRELFLYAG